MKALYTFSSIERVDHLPTGRTPTCSPSTQPGDHNKWNIHHEPRYSLHGLFPQPFRFRILGQRPGRGPSSFNTRPLLLHLFHRCLKHRPAFPGASPVAAPVPLSPAQVDLLPTGCGSNGRYHTPRRFRL